MNECILVVDDDREIVGAIAIVLEREGYTVRRAYDGLGAVEQALDPAVRLILIDVMMPKLDGLSALMRIREKRNLPVIVLSAKSEDTDKILGLSMGADDYVTKPYNPQELAARVRSQLRRYTLLGDGRGSTQIYLQLTQLIEDLAGIATGFREDGILHLLRENAGAAHNDVSDMVVLDLNIVQGAHLADDRVVHINDAKLQTPADPRRAADGTTRQP